MLKLVDIHTKYGDSQILQGVSLEVKEGQIVGLLGRNGMGKTTTVRSIIGFSPPHYGTISYRGNNIVDVAPYQIPRMGIALVPQGRRIFSTLSVMENLTVAARGAQRPGAWTLDRIYSLFPILRQRSAHKGNHLSGGEQQMLAIARALMTNPDLLLMDEPSEGLAPIMVQQLGAIIKQLNENGISILLVEQNLSLALGVSHYLYIMRQGRIAHECTPQELKRNQEIQLTCLGISV